MLLLQTSVFSKVSRTYGNVEFRGVRGSGLGL